MGMSTNAFRTLSAVLALSASLFAADGLPDPAIDAKNEKGMQTAVFAGGCFWCTEVVFEQLQGVSDVVSGYAGDSKETAKYELVSAGRTKHAESIQIKYDPSKISFGQLLKVFFTAAHDPTQLNRQGPDHGPQYRSAIFYANDEQKRVAEAYIQQLTAAKSFDKPIVTQVVPLTAFHAAEQYHQDFVRRNPSHGYVVVNAVPKVKKVKQYFPALVRSTKS
jgi:peptide-methionine (S)-S-oxide reductase